MDSPRLFERRGNRTGARGPGTTGLALVLLVLPACAVANVDVSAEDDSVLFPGGRLSWILDRGLEQAGEGDSMERSGAAVSIDLDVSTGSGSADQLLRSGEVVVYGGEVFRGPGELRVDFDLTRALLDARVASSPLPGFSIEAFGGLEYSAMQVDVRQGDPAVAPSGSGKVTAIGPALGAALVWQPLEALRLSAEGRLGFGFSSEVGAIELLSLDIGLHFFPIESVGIFGGWRRVSYAAESPNRFESGLDFGLSGPVLALWIRL